MEDKSGNKQKPLRPTGNKMKDLYNAYFRNEGSRSVPISGPEGSESTHTDDEILSEIEAEVKAQEEAVKIEELHAEYSKIADELGDKLIAIEKERDDLKEQLFRKAAELENVIKRTSREKMDMIDYANEKLLMKFLPVSDDLGNAINAAKQTTDINSLLTGIEMIYNKVTRLLEEEGVKPIESAIGKPFNVNYHEAMLQMPSEYEEGSVVQELQKGYMHKDKVMRHTKVITSSGQPEGE